jgi:hypothetical protein
MAKKQLPKRMFKNQEMASPFQPSRSSGKVLKRMARDHPDVLQNIEFTLGSCHRQDPSLDDRVMDAALRASLANQPPDDPRVATVFNALASARAMRQSLPDDVWSDGLQVIEDSVHTHSDRAPGETSYLAFVAPYVQ